MLKVLIIDDDDIVLLVERKMLQRCLISTEPLSFKGGKQALEYLKETNDNEDVLILLDINMPQMNGWEFLQHLEELQNESKIYVIMVTSSIDRYDKEVAQKFSKVIGFIEKPITAENCEKIKTIREMVNYFN